MHSAIFVLSNLKDNITEEDVRDLLDEDTLYGRLSTEWEGMVDYIHRDDNLKDWLGQINGLKYDDNCVFTVDNPTEYFKKQYEEFVDSAKALTETTMENFISTNYYKCQSNLDSLRTAYNDTLGFVAVRAYNRQKSGHIDFEIISMDWLVRYVNDYPEKNQFKVHAAYDYHY